MVIFAVVDGTGEFSNANYQDRFAHSHVNKLSRGDGLGGPAIWTFQPFYHRGLRIFGNDTFIHACKVFQDLRKNHFKRWILKLLDEVIIQ